MKITDNVLIVDNVSEALCGCIGDGAESFGMLICEINCSDGIKRQVHLVVTSYEDDFIENEEGMPVLTHDEDYRLKYILP